MIVSFFLNNETFAQKLLTLEDCRKMALESNKEIAIKRVKQQAAHSAKSVAATLNYPKINLTGSYIHTSRELSILNDEQNAALGHLGTALVGSASQDLNAIITGLVKKGVISMEEAQGLGQMTSKMEQTMNGLGEKISNDFKTDTREIWMGAVTVTQPLYTGGKISASNKIASIGEKLAEDDITLSESDVNNSITKVYWTVVSLKHKQALAKNYLSLLEKLESDVQKMVKEGVATKSDELNVSVKKNEAELSVIQVEDGLSLAKMLICQICGMPINSNITLADENTEDIIDNGEAPLVNIDALEHNRPELRMLSNSTDIANQGLKIARSDYFPTLALTAGYVLTNPSMYNGFERKLKGMWNVGVVMNMTLSNFWEGKGKVNLAKSTRQVALLQKDEAKEKINLQVNQNQFKLNEARKKMNLTQKNIQSAEENLKNANLGFKEGIFTATTVMEAQTAWMKAKSQMIDAQVDVKLALSELNKSLGN